MVHTHHPIKVVPLRPDRKTTAHERREAPRAGLVSVLRYEIDGIWFDGRMTDVSSGGVFIDTTQPAPIGTRIVVRIEAEATVLQFVGRVVQSQPNIGMGVEFVNLSACDRAFLAALGG